MKIPATYRRPLAIAITLHVVLAIILIVKLPSWGYQYHSSHGKAKIVHATAVTSQSVQQAMRDITHREQAHQRAEQQRLAELKRQADREKLQQKEAARRVAKMKQQQLALKRQHDKEVKALKALKQKQIKIAQLAKQRAAKLKKAKALAALKRHKALQAKQEALQKKLLAQQLAGDSNQLQQIQTAQMRGIVDKYKALILSAIASNWLVPGGVSKNLASVFEVQIAPGGMVISVKLIKSSGNQALDQSAQTAIYKSSPLPVPKSPSAFDNFRDLRLTVSPKEVIHS